MFRWPEVAGSNLDLAIYSTICYSKSHSFEQTNVKIACSLPHPSLIVNSSVSPSCHVVGPNLSNMYFLDE